MIVYPNMSHSLAPSTFKGEVADALGHLGRKEKKKKKLYLFLVFICS